MLISPLLAAAGLCWRMQDRVQSSMAESPQALLPRKGCHSHDTNASACQAVSWEWRGVTPPPFFPPFGPPPPPPPQSARRREFGSLLHPHPPTTHPRQRDP